MESPIHSRQDRRERQLELFAGEWISWETLPKDVHSPLIEMVSLLLEGALSRQSFAGEEGEYDV
jgi:hypothetical protein